MSALLPYPALATLLALLVYGFDFLRCGQARGRHKVVAPAVTGHPDFERKLRIQQNMVEQLIVFLPALWIFSETASAFWGGLLGLVFVIGRLLYSLAYAADPAKRSLGFMIGAAATATLLLGGLAATLRLIVLLT